MSKHIRSFLPITHPPSHDHCVGLAGPSMETVARVRDSCLCLHVQRAARALARRYDEALRPLDLTNGQFSLMMALSRRSPVSLTGLAHFLGMDRTTLTAHLKVLERRQLVACRPDPADRRVRRPALTAAGRTLLNAALPLWEEAQGETEARLAAGEAVELRGLLMRLA